MAQTAPLPWAWGTPEGYKPERLPAAPQAVDDPHGGPLSRIEDLLIEKAAAAARRDPWDEHRARYPMAPIGIARLR